MGKGLLRCRSRQLPGDGFACSGDLRSEKWHGRETVPQQVEFSSVQVRMLAMSLRALGAIRTSIFSTAVLRGFRPDLGFDFRDKSAYCLLALQDDALALIDFVEPLFGCLPKCFQLRFSFL